ncbi:pentapeptide repeat-containing protein [Allonocardiopsis opalescens]|uniref:Uncharacterized protein YjbI with pentapeptide repeats n=1 Tax=Allonocardiopsis opalescens TaxID=1144618 RepID=A0A2T0QD45_9ACTN|nr:pentapeptide repeat-containing protein [Allonocardiopsis opalescens]PRY01839.1 uncharacterized protein YjbI with pentapeptide repeats [Allonocardiopsis opalescens]
MSEPGAAAVVEPRRWPADADGADALRAHLEWRTSGGRTGRELVGHPELVLRDADLSGMDLAWLRLWHTDLTGVRMAHTDLTKTELTGALLDGADLTGARLVKTEARDCSARSAVFARADLLGARMGGSDLRGADLRRARLNGAHLSRCDLRGADLRDAGFGPPGGGGRTVLSRARLAGSRLDGARGHILGPVDIGENDEDGPQLLEGDRLADWFRDRGAPEVHVER